MKQKFTRILSFLLIYALLLGSVPVLPAQAVTTEGQTVSGSEVSGSGAEGTIPGSEVSGNGTGGTVSGSEVSGNGTGGTVSGTQGSGSESGGTVSGTQGNGSESGGTVSGSEGSGSTEGGAEENEPLPEGMVALTFQTTAALGEAAFSIVPLDELGNETAAVTERAVVPVKKEFRFKIKVAEGYKVTEVETPAGLLTAQNQIYSLTPTGSITIKITTVELKKYDVTFSYNEEQVKGLKVYREKKDVTLEDKVAANMPENSVISFDVELESMMKIVKVTANGKALQPVNGTSYTLEPLKQAVEITIETSLDPAKCNNLSFVLMGHTGSATISNKGKIYHGGDTILTTDTREEIGLSVHKDYEIKEVLINGEKVEFTGTKTIYTFNFSAQSRIQKIQVTTAPKTSLEVKKVVFANKSEHISYSVNTYAVGQPEVVIAEKESGKNNSYLVKPGQTTLEFTILAQNGYEPKVEIPTGVLYDTVKKDNKYVYSLVIASLGSKELPTEIIIDENPQIRTISVRYDKDKIEEMYATVDGKIFQGQESYDSNLKKQILTFTYSYNKEIALQIKTKEGYVLQEVLEGTTAAGEKKASPYKNEYLYTIKIDKDKYVELKIKGEYHSKIFTTQGTQTLLEKEGDSFLAEVGNKYVARLYLGQETQSLGKAVLKSGSKIINGNLPVIDSENIEFEIPSTEKGKTLTLELTVKGTTTTSFVKIKVLPEMKISSIAGVKSGKVSQEIDTLKEYKITSNLALKNVAAEVVTAVPEDQIITEEQRAELNQKAAEIFVPAIEDDVLKMRVNIAEAGEKAYIKLYDPTKTAEGKKYYISGGTFLITAQTPAFVSKKPALNQGYGTNLEIGLNLTLKGAAKLESGALWYKIQVEPKYDSKTSDIIKETTSAFTIYRLYTKDTQLETLQVVGRDLSSIQEGDIPSKADFNVSVSLVQTKDKEVPIESGEQKNVIFTSKEAVKKVMSTKAPLYETALGVKIINGTVFSGQENVVVATPVFSKNTSYRKLECYTSEEGISVEYNENNEIIVSVDSEVKPGKYTIEAVAEAAENTLPSKKEFTIQVVQGIHHLEVKASSTLYKAYKKTGTLNVEVIYNENSDKQPKNKKVEWFLQDAEENDIVKGHEKYDYFRIKEGKITVHEKYIVSPEEEEYENNRFRVKVVARDFERKGEEIVGYSDWITVTNTGISLGEVVLVKENPEEELYQVVGRSNQQVPADQIHGSRLMVLQRGVPERESYTEEHFVEEEVLELLNFTSSNSKSLEILEDRSIKVKDINSVLTLTAKTTDGSNKSVSLSNLGIILAKPTDLGIIVTNLRTQSMIADTYSTQEAISYYGLKDEKLRINLKDKGQKNSFFGGDHEFNVTGAKIISSNPLEGSYDMIATSENIVITLLNKANNTERQFRLVNKTYDNSKVKNSQPLSFKVEGTLETGNCQKGQRIYFTLPKSAVGKYSHVWITMDQMELQNSQKKENYEKLAAAIVSGLGEIQTLDEQGRAVLVFDISEDEEQYFIPDLSFSYKFNVALGSVTENYEFVSESKTNPVTLKTTKAKAMNTAMKNSYSISAKENGMAVLAMKDKKVTLQEVGTLMNKNNSGKVNRFAEFFEIAELENENGEISYVIRLQDGVDPAEIKKADTSGYLTEYVCSNGKESKVVKNTLIKVTMKNLIKKYKISEAGVFKSEEVDTKTSLVADGQKVAAGQVYVAEKEAFTVDVTGEGELHIQSKPDKKLKTTNKFTVYVLPEDSFYGASVSSEEEMKKYGIKLTAVVKLKNKATATGKIKFTAKDKKVVLGSDQFIASQEAGKGSYRVEIPYTKTVDWEVESIRENKADSLIKVQEITGEDKIELTLSKEALKSAYAKNKKIYGSTVTVPIRAEFGEGTKAETHNLKVTLPKMPIQLEAAKKAIDAVSWKNLSLNYRGTDTTRLVEENRSLVEEQLAKIVAADSDLTYTITGTAKAPTKTADGKVEYTVILTDVISQAQRRLTPVFVIERVYTTPEELEAEVIAAVSQWSNGKITNQTQIEDILSSIRTTVKLKDHPHLRLYAKNVAYEAATMEKDGKIEGNFRILSLKDSDGAAVDIPYEFTIPKLLTVEEAVEAIRNTVESLTLSNTDLGDGREEKEQYILKLAGDAVKGNEYSVTIKRGLEGEPALGSESGRATIILRLTYVTEESNFEDITCEFEVAG